MGMLLQSEVKSPKALSLSGTGLTRQRQPSNQRSQWGVRTPACSSGFHRWFAGPQKPSFPTLGLSFSPQQHADVSIHLMEACGHTCLQSLSFPGEGRHLCKQSSEAPCACWLCSKRGTGPRLQPRYCGGNNAGSVCPAAALTFPSAAPFSVPTRFLCRAGGWGGGVGGILAERLVSYQKVLKHFGSSHLPKI